MAEDKIALKIEIEADRAQMSLGELEKGFAGLQETLKGQERVTDEGKEAFKRLSTQMAQTSADIKNIELGFEGLDREQITSEFAGMAGGIGDVTASLVLMGGENETIEQIGGTIEKAMAISMGIKGVMEGAAAANKLYNNSVKAKAIVEKVAAAGTWILNAANKALNTTLKMNPIGLILIAITAVVGAIWYFKDAIMNVIEVALKPFQWIIDLVVDGLQAMGIMASDEANAQAEAAQKTIEATQKRIKATEKLLAAHKKATESMISDMDFEIRKRKANGEDTTEIEIKKLKALILAAKEEQRIQKLRRDDMHADMLLRVTAGGVTIAQYTEYLEKVTEVGVAEAKARKEQIQGERDLEVAIIEIRKEGEKKEEIIRKESSKKRKAQKEKDKAIEEKAAADEKKINEKAAADAIALEKDKIKLLEDLEAKAIDDKNVRALAELENTQTRDREALIEKYGQDTELLLALETEQELAMVTLIEGIEKEARDNKAALDKEAREKDLADNQIALDKKREQSEKDFESAKQLIGAISSLNGAALANDLKNAGDNEVLKEKLRKASFEREKKLNIAMALINGAQAQMSILAQTPKADFGVATVIAMVAAAATTIGQIAAIKSTSYQGGGSVAPPPESPVLPDGAGAGGAGAQITPVTNTSTILGNQQVYVTETDITSTQNNVSVIEESATF